MGYGLELGHAAVVVATASRCFAEYSVTAALGHGVRMDTGQLTLPTVRARVMSSTNCIADRRVDGPLMPSAAGSRFRQRMKEQTEDNWTGCEQSA